MWRPLLDWGRLREGDREENPTNFSLMRDPDAWTRRFGSPRQRSQSLLPRKISKHK